MNYVSNKLEVILSGFVIIFAVFSTIITMNEIDVTGMSFALDFFVFFTFTIFYIIGYQALVNIFYLRWQSKDEPR